MCLSAEQEVEKGRKRDVTQERGEEKERERDIIQKPATPRKGEERVGNE